MTIPNRNLYSVSFFTCKVYYICYMVSWSLKKSWFFITGSLNMFLLSLFFRTWEWWWLIQSSLWSSKCWLMQQESICYYYISSFREMSTQICSNKCGWYYFRRLTVVAGGTRVSRAFTGTFKCVSSLRALASVFTVVWHTPRKRKILKTLDKTRIWKDFLLMFCI